MTNIITTSSIPIIIVSILCLGHYLTIIIIIITTNIIITITNILRVTATMVTSELVNGAN